MNPCKAPPFSVKCGTWLATAWHKIAASFKSSENVVTRFGMQVLTKQAKQRKRNDRVHTVGSGTTLSIIPYEDTSSARWIVYVWGTAPPHTTSMCTFGKAVHSAEIQISPVKGKRQIRQSLVRHRWGWSILHPIFNISLGEHHGKWRMSTSSASASGCPRIRERRDCSQAQ